MANLDRDQDTVFALATPSGHGGLAVLRISGTHAVQIVRKNCRFLTDRPESHRVYYGYFRDQKDEILDEVLVSYFTKGRSFTGEETVEISCHGSPAVVSALSEELVKSGCRLAAGGEFTYRAFMNGRIDLVQAESVLALVQSRSKAAVRAANRQLRGELSRSYEKIENDVTWILANMEAAIDFSTEDIAPYSAKEMLGVLEGCLEQTKKLIGSFERGRMLTDGFHVALIGRPNAGKSSLLNALIQEDRAIVTDVPGTTRDTVEAVLVIDGVSVRFTDTAGLRDSEDKVEKIGIQKARQASTSADLIFYVLDLSLRADAEDIRFLSEVDMARTVIVGNKQDIAGAAGMQDFIESLSRLGLPLRQEFVACAVSAKTGQRVQGLLDVVREQVKKLLGEDSPVVLNARNVEKLEQVRSALIRTHELLCTDASPELISFELQCALQAVNELLGKTFDDQVMDRVFREFCIGK